MRVRVSAFEPFGGRTENQSLRLARALSARQPVDVRVLPVRFGALPDAISALAAEPIDRWLMLGESTRAEGLVLEAQSFNDISARLPDNDGLQPEHAPVEPGPPLRATSAPLGKLLAALVARGVPATCSADAGRYACNAAYHLALARVPAERVLFVHVPDDPARAPQALLRDGLEALLHAWS